MGEVERHGGLIFQAELRKKKKKKNRHKYLVESNQSDADFETPELRAPYASDVQPAVQLSKPFPIS